MVNFQALLWKKKKKVLRMVWHVCALVRAVWWLDRNASARVNVCARALEQQVTI